jgi:hypothetical protein
MEYSTERMRKTPEVVDQEERENKQTSPPAVGLVVVAFVNKS